MHYSTKVHLYVHTYTISNTLASLRKCLYFKVSLILQRDTLSERVKQFIFVY